MGHERTGRDDRVRDAPIDQVAENAPLLGHRHCAGDGQHDATRRIADHLQQYGKCLSKLAAGECRFGHGAQQAAKRRDSVESKTLQRFKTVLTPVVKGSRVHGSRQPESKLGYVEVATGSSSSAPSVCGSMTKRGTCRMRTSPSSIS